MYLFIDGGFALAADDGDPPATAPRISAARHAQLMAGQAAGATIVADDDGRPQLGWPDKRPIAERRAAAIVAVKREARRRILAIAPEWRQINDLTLMIDATLGDRPVSDVAVLSRRAAIDALRERSSLVEAAVEAMTHRQIDDFDVAADAHWEEDHNG